MHRLFCLLTLIATLAAGDFITTKSAAGNEPVAIRKWPAGNLSVETFPGPKFNIWPDGTFKTTTTDNMPVGDTIDVQQVKLGDNSAFAVQLNASGAQITIIPASSMDQPWHGDFPESLAANLLVLGGDSAKSLMSPQTKRLVTHLDPPQILLSDVDPQSETFSAISEWLLSESQSRRISHNTLAISAKRDDAPARQVIAMTDQAWPMPADLNELFTAMEKSCKASQEVFAELSAEQMNFEPSNGTHTPRWNAEHMMGRQLKFFSEIYHAVDPAIPVMDLNPKQMPPDYRAAHPDWDGAEEARQMERVSQFCRRFAYLLDGISPDQKAPASRWPSLAALLKQMDRHYDEHTANTVQKFSLPDWPAK
ncbi:DinB family protein [Rubripirellula reticaptiva]|uniref:DinB superfamily protein n=1 Tax=Rubripirellula reticaptiva TaxID=2528013 RepID=A0A5C6EKL4_9BACT|nr:DinB family protein [Rubripirellula reticaptiva]TWU49358.1 hypothetical protein Poly59_39730 [Rubripirellula reticaptiva]